MLYIRQPKFVMTAANKLIPIIAGPDGTLLTNEYVLDVQNIANCVFACRDTHNKSLVYLVRYATLHPNVSATAQRFHDVSVRGIATVGIDSVMLITQLNTTFAQMLRTIGLEQEVPVMLPKRWLTLD